MKISVIFVVILVVLSAFLGQSDAKWKGLKKIEKAGKRVFNAAEKALPVVQGCAGVAAVASVAALAGKK
ncbi:hypothetical protein RN001_009663 [Aquatica leii]|uniref:Uncharacterized protein n=1 Tax=Aquatica leii TaxID=1421715 RepID=A0AAN7SE00_9COLE|nr:hypothetical protein RN001_009663 [Aquatica leii]